MPEGTPGASAPCGPLPGSLARREALPGADFVTTQFRVGQLEARIKDERIPDLR